MKSDLKVKKTIWIYAVVLFTSAFIVLLITAYSQIKFNRNLKDIKTREENNAILTNQSKYSLNSILKENKILQKEIEKSKAEINSIKQENSKIKQELNLFKKNGEEISTNIEFILIAEEFYKNKKYKEAALQLINVKFDKLSGYSKQKFINLSQNTFQKAHKEFYYEGIKRYYKNSYKDSMAKFYNSQRIQ